MRTGARRSLPTWTIAALFAGAGAPAPAVLFQVDTLLDAPDGDEDGATACDRGAIEMAPALLFHDGFEDGSPSRWSASAS